MIIKKCIHILCMLSLLLMVGCTEDSDINVVNSESTSETFESTCNTSESTCNTSESTCNTSESTCNTSESEENYNNDIYVYVCGAVAEEGVYKLSSDDRVCDALDRAGGLNEDAAAGYINLAEKLSDGEKIYFPTQAEVDENLVPEMEVNGTVDPASEGKASEESGQSDGLVNINTATREQLMTLPGIGEAKADMIISYRDEHGCFNSIEDIMNISGIKTGVYNKIKDHITVQR